MFSPPQETITVRHLKLWKMASVSLALMAFDLSAAPSDTVRFATFNAALNRNTSGELIADLTTADNAQAQAVAEIIQRTAPDVLLINEFDFDPNGLAVELFQRNYLGRSQNGAAAIDYPYVFVAPSNTGLASGFDLDNDGDTTGPGDNYGFGFFPGQFGMVLLSKYPIENTQARTFQNFRWKDMPGALLPDDPTSDAPLDWYSSAELEAVRLSSKSHWDVPIRIHNRIVHVLASHPTPPVFDGTEDRNGLRNHDEIRFWADYISPLRSRYVYDDSGKRGGLRPGASFVVMGDLNADPFDGDSTGRPAWLLLNHPKINTRKTPASEGGPDAAARQGEINALQLADSAFDTADFADGTPGNLRVDYVLPSYQLKTHRAGVFWPTENNPLFDLVGEYPFPSSDHRLVWVDVRPKLGWHERATD